MTRLWTLLPAAPALALLAAAAPARAASLQSVPSYGTSPTAAHMYVYKPDSVKANPAILVALHYCNGTANDYFTGTGFKGQADSYGFIVIYPQTASSDGCWDVHSDASLKHDGGGDSGAIVAMVKYAVATYGANAERVYAAGTSSGAMMTQVLMGAYPDVFKGGASFAGVPYGCFAGSSGWNSACAGGQITKSAQAWGDDVRNAYPGYGGYRPRLMIYQGTSDETLSYNNFAESIKQWTNVLGVSGTPTTTETNQPQASFTRTRYKDTGGVVRVEAVSEAGQPHALIVPADQPIKFFGLDGDADPGVTAAAGSGAGGMGAGGMGAGGAGMGGGGAGGLGASAGAGAGGAGGVSPGGAAGTAGSAAGMASSAGGGAGGGMGGKAGTGGTLASAGHAGSGGLATGGGGMSSGPAGMPGVGGAAFGGMPSASAGHDTGLSTLPIAGGEEPGGGCSVGAGERAWRGTSLLAFLAGLVVARRRLRAARNRGG